MDVSSPNLDHNLPSEFLDLQGSTTEETLASVRAAIANLEEEHRSKGTRLSGRIIHVTHYLPVVATLKTKEQLAEGGAPISPPKTPPVKDIVELEAEQAHKAGKFFSLFIQRA